MARSTDRVLTKSLLRATELLGLSTPEVAKLLGVSERAVRCLASGKRLIGAASKQAEFAVLIVRTFATLDRLVGCNARQRQAWMRSYNRSLNGRPAELVQTIQGLVGVVVYLDAMRAAN